MQIKLLLKINKMTAHVLYSPKSNNNKYTVSKTIIYVQQQKFHKPPWK